MIKTINELQDYILEDAEDYDDDDLFKRRRMMTSPGCSKVEIETLKKALPSIPESYTKWVEAVNLNGISVGYFEVSPFPFNPEGIVANLIEGNEEGVLFSEYIPQYHLYSVAATDGYGIFVATASSPYKEGEIIAIDEGIYVDKENPTKWIFRLAKDFEQFLIIAGNLNQLNREVIKDDSIYDEKKEEFLECLKKLGVAEEYHAPWMMMF